MYKLCTFRSFIVKDKLLCRLLDFCTKDFPQTSCKLENFRFDKLFIKNVFFIQADSEKHFYNKLPVKSVFLYSKF